MPAFPQAPYTQEFKDKCKTLSDNNTNPFRLKCLKKDELKMICVHNNIDVRGLKDKLVEKIVHHRDTQFQCPDVYSINEIRDYLNPFMKYIKNYPGYYDYWTYNNSWTFNNLHKTNASEVVRVTTITLENGRQHIDNFPYQTMTLKNFPKINLVVYLRRIRQLTKNRPSILPSEINNIYEAYNKQEIIEKIKKSLLKLSRVQTDIPKEVKVVNRSGITLELYKVKFRNDNRDYSECSYIGRVNTAMQLRVTYKEDDNINILAVKQRQDGYSHYNPSYFMDLKDYMVINTNVRDKDVHDRIIIKNIMEEEIKTWKKAALKCDFLLRELKRLGCEDHDTYGCILDLHQDITIPEHSERDKDIAGIPSAYTNVVSEN